MRKEELLNHVAEDLLIQSCFELGARVIKIDKVMDILSKYLEDEEKIAETDRQIF